MTINFLRLALIIYAYTINEKGIIMSVGRPIKTPVTYIK